MSQQIIITVFAEDRPGIIRDISTVILNHQGNWLDSSLSQLAGKFAGIILVSANNKNIAKLKTDLLALSSAEFCLSVENTTPKKQQTPERATVSIVGNDRPGIIDEIANLLAANNVNVIN